MKIFGRFPRAKLWPPPNCNASSICSDINSAMTIRGDERLDQAGMSQDRLQRSLGENLRGRRWVERFAADRPAVDEETLRQYYDLHVAEFGLPNASAPVISFLAAPPGTLPEIVEAKRQLINSLADRSRGGEEFESLVWETSEDEATKPRGGDLSYFCERRIPAAFLQGSLADERRGASKSDSHYAWLSSVRAGLRRSRHGRYRSRKRGPRFSPIFKMQRGGRRSKISPPNGAEVRHCVGHGFGIEFVRA